MKIGVFGGTFNPVHLGHLNCLKSVAEQASLDKMIVMPDRIPPHKQAEDLASSEDRSVSYTHLRAHETDS